DKLGAIVKLETGGVACWAKAVAKGNPDLFDPCANKAVAKYAKAFQAGSCAGGAGDCRIIAFGDCVVPVASMFPGPGPNKCEAARVNAMGKLAGALLNCVAEKAPADVDPCAGKALGKFRKAWDKVTGCVGDGQADDAALFLGAACVRPVVTLD